MRVCLNFLESNPDEEDLYTNQFLEEKKRRPDRCQQSVLVSVSTTYGKTNQLPIQSSSINDPPPQIFAFHAGSGSTLRPRLRRELPSRIIALVVVNHDPRFPPSTPTLEMDMTGQMASAPRLSGRTVSRWTSCEE